jgi:hypothetical protein
MGLQALNKAVNHQNCRQSTKQSIHEHNLQQQIAKSADCMLNLDLYLSEMLNIAAGLESDSNQILQQLLSTFKGLEIYPYISMFLCNISAKTTV